MAEKASKTGIALPLSRIKTIMKSSPDVSNVGNDSLWLIAKATELFVQDLAVQTTKRANDARNIQYNDLANIVHTDENLMFLQDIVPQKVKVKDYWQMMENLPQEEDSS